MSTVLERAEVAELVAMLEGEPECNIRDGADPEHVWDCTRPARWIARLHCGHPLVVCDFHKEAIDTEFYGSGTCPCGSFSIWSHDPNEKIVWHRGMNAAVHVTGPALVFLPL